MAELPAVDPALALLELDSIAAGIEAGDAMAKRAPVDVIRAGTVHPGKYLVLVAGAVADVEEAVDAGREVGGPSVVDVVLLPNAHPDLVDGIRGDRRAPEGEALGIVETTTVAAIIEAADAGLKGAHVRLLEIRLADDLGGKGYLLFDGSVADVEAAVEIAVDRIAASPGLAHRVIPRLHAEMAEQPRRGRPVRAAGPEVAAVQLARVVGTVVASVKSPGLEGVKLLVIQPLDRDLGRPAASSSRPTPSTWPGRASCVYFVAAREAAQAMPDPFVPVDHAIVGIVDAVSITVPRDGAP